MRLEPVVIGKKSHLDDMLKFYMGKNTPERRDFIVKNLMVEEPINESATAETDAALPA